MYIIKIGNMFLQNIYVSAKNSATHFISDVGFTADSSDVFDSGTFKTFKEADYTRDILKEVFQLYNDLIEIVKKKVIQMNKIPTISDKELIKWTSILGSYRMKELYFMNKIILTKEQLDKLIEIGRYENEKEIEKFVSEYDKYIKKKTLHK